MWTFSAVSFNGGYGGWPRTSEAKFGALVTADKAVGATRRRESTAEWQCVKSSQIQACTGKKKILIWIAKKLNLRVHCAALICQSSTHFLIHIKSGDTCVIFFSTFFPLVPYIHRPKHKRSLLPPPPPPSNFLQLPF